eukprot:TRINITY_DN5746_c0_g1_i1.p1 TRINITY_DN5746_c0_g1~~TRINITY_DN5746_c0_g1_i1.p1  ORF type:complete len:503 (+),score=152.71 TRINITY_DN5746_c0_g1_i1:573-2081(+)
MAERKDEDLAHQPGVGGTYRSSGGCSAEGSRNAEKGEAAQETSRDSSGAAEPQNPQSSQSQQLFVRDSSAGALQSFDTRRILPEGLPEGLRPLQSSLQSSLLRTVSSGREMNGMPVPESPGNGKAGLLWGPGSPVAVVTMLNAGEFLPAGVGPVHSILPHNSLSSDAFLLYNFEPLRPDGDDDETDQEPSPQLIGNRVRLDSSAMLSDYMYNVTYPGMISNMEHYSSAASPTSSAPGGGSLSDGEEDEDGDDGDDEADGDGGEGEEEDEQTEQQALNVQMLLQRAAALRSKAREAAAEAAAKAAASVSATERAAEAVAAVSALTAPTTSREQQQRRRSSGQGIVGGTGGAGEEAGQRRTEAAANIGSMVVRGKRSAPSGGRAAREETVAPALRAQQQQKQQKEGEGEKGEVRKGEEGGEIKGEEVEGDEPKGQEIKAEEMTAEETEEEEKKEEEKGDERMEDVKGEEENMTEVHPLLVPSARLCEDVSLAPESKFGSLTDVP